MLVLLAAPACAQHAGRSGPQLGTALIRPSVGGDAPCTVARVIDGDTFVCEGGSRIRLILIDTPELDDVPRGDSARAFMVSLMPPGRTVRLEFDVGLYDRYGRVLAYVYADSVFVNREIVRRGIGRVAVFPPNVRMLEIIRAAADSARREGVVK
jgi:micrococcal nuclease